MTTTVSCAPRRRRFRELLPAARPAMVAGVAYLDPGNVASNASAGARYGYLLVWVVVVANAMAWLIQYLSAKLGLSTGESLPQLLGRRIRSRSGRYAYWVQAELVAMATDVAEVLGGAIALNLLFGLPLHRRRHHHGHRLDAPAPAAQPARLAGVRAGRDRARRDHRDRILRGRLRRPDRRPARSSPVWCRGSRTPDRCCSPHPSSAPR